MVSPTKTTRPGRNRTGARLLLAGAFVSTLAASGPPLHAQALTTRLAIIQAEQRLAPTAADLARIRTAARSRDVDTARLAIRSLGRIGRAGAIPDLLLALRHSAPEARAEASDALAQATRALKTESAGPNGLGAIQAALLARLSSDSDTNVRAAVAESIARLPYHNAGEVQRATDALLEFSQRAAGVTDRLGLAKALEALVRLHSPAGPLDVRIATTLTGLVRRDIPGQNSLRDERVRRLALQGLMNGGQVEPHTLESAATDPDAQVRRLAMTAGGTATALNANVLITGTIDPSPMVRIAALRSLTRQVPDAACGAALRAAADADMGVALVALDLLAPCGHSSIAVAYLEQTAGDLADLSITRGWHRAAHALVALGTAAPSKAAALLPAYLTSPIWQVRVYAAQAAALAGDRTTLERLAVDDNDNVCEAALEGLHDTFGHAADTTYIWQLARNGYQVLRIAAMALAGTGNRDDAVPALKAALDRLTQEKSDNSYSARQAIVTTLTELGEKVPPTTPRLAALPPAITAAELRRLAAPRARVTVRDVGRFEIALFTTQAPASVIRFARLAESGYYNGLTFHRVVPNFVIQGGSPGANEYIGASPFMRDELGLWPHVRGSIGTSTRGRDTGDAQIFIDLVDNPRLDHEYTVFGQLLNGAEVVDRILEGDIIESVDIVP